MKIGKIIFLSGNSSQEIEKSLVSVLDLWMVELGAVLSGNTRI